MFPQILQNSATQNCIFTPGNLCHSLQVPHLQILELFNISEQHKINTLSNQQTRVGLSLNHRFHCYIKDLCLHNSREIVPELIVFVESRDSTVAPDQSYRRPREILLRIVSQKDAKSVFLGPT